MIAPVDVLAVMDEAVGFIDASGDFDSRDLREARAAVAAEFKAHADLLDRYTSLVNCGDCGSWDPETEDEVKASRASLARVRGAA